MIQHIWQLDILYYVLYFHQYRLVRPSKSKHYCKHIQDEVNSQFILRILCLVMAEDQVCVHTVLLVFCARFLNSGHRAHDETAPVFCTTLTQCTEDHL